LPIVLAVHHPRFIRVQLQPNATQPSFNCRTHLMSLALSHTADHRIVCETLEPDLTVGNSRTSHMSNP
jgi:hypothetical protein